MAALAAAVSAGCGGDEQTGAVKYPVSGSVVVNGAPAAGVVVYFHATGEGLSGRDRSPTAVTDSNGRFELSSTGRKDGAAAGEYAVTLKWPFHPLMTDQDRLRGTYANVEGTELQVVIPPQATELASIELSAPKEWLEPPTGASSQ